MPSFKDQADREWKIAIDAKSIMAIRDDCDANFLLNDNEQNNTFTRLQADPVLLCRVIFLLCHFQRIERGVSDESFYIEVIGDAIDRATEALLAAIVNFTPGRTRKIIEVFARQERLQEKATDKAIARLNDPALEDKMTAAMEREIDARIEKVLTQPGSATASPASSESAPPA